MLPRYSQHVARTIEQLVAGQHVAVDGNMLLQHVALV